MRWMIWPRQYGKSYQVGRWFSEDPANRVILTENEALARLRRQELQDDIPQGFTAATWRRHLKERVVSFRTWHNSRRGADPFNGEIAVDGLEYMLPRIFGGNVTVATGAGVNDEPDRDRAQLADTYHEQMARKFGMSIEELQRS